MAVRRYDPTRRAVEIVRPVYGSGYLIGGRLVLTASHLVGRPDSACRVRWRGSPEQAGWDVNDARCVWAPSDPDAGPDVALVELPEQISPIEPAMLGHLPDGSDGGWVSFTMYGWPEWAQTRLDDKRLGAGGRQVPGTIYLADRSSEGFLVLEPERRPEGPAPAEKRSAWEGMSGAAVVCDDLVVAVQHRHQRSDRPGSLEAVLLTACLTDEAFRALLIAHGVPLEFPEARSLAVGQLGTGATPTEDRIVDRVTAALDERLGRTAEVVRLRDDPAGMGHPRVFEVRHRDNPHFVGREALLRELADRFAAGDGPSVLVQAIRGLGGVGKTQTAVRFAYSHAADYDGVWLVRAEEPVQLATDYIELAPRLGLRFPTDAKPDDIVAAVRTRLEATEDAGERWLLIFDNAVPRFADDDPVGALAPLLPRRGNCDVLITSRARDWRGVAEPRDVDVLPLPEAVDFLTRRTGQDDEVTAEDLANELGRLPLALEQAAAYVADKDGLVTLADYLDRFQRQPLDRLQLDRAQTGEYAEVVAMTWLISFAEIEARSPSAADLLRLCAFLAPEAIPLDDLVAHARELPESLAAALQDPGAAVDAVAPLLSLSLVSAGPGRTLDVHRLVQLVVRGSLTVAEQRVWSVTAVAAVDAAFPQESDDVRTWPVCGRLLAHALTATQHAEEVEALTDAAGQLLNHVGGYLLGRGEFAAARGVLERALAIAQAALPADHPDLGQILNSMALALRAQGDLAGARALNERALAIAEAALPADHPDLGQILYGMAGVLQDQGDLAGARPLHERALSINEAAFGPDHFAVAGALSNLALVVQAQGDLAGAREWYERALAINEAALGSAHPSVATVLGNLAIVLRAQGDPAGARVLLERALVVHEQQGEDARYIAALDVLADLERESGNPSARATRLREALVVLRRSDPSYREGYYFFSLGLQAVESGQPEAGLRLLAVSIAVDRLIGDPDAEEHLTMVREVAESYGLGDDQLKALLAEVEAAYAGDRGEALLAAGFPEAKLDDTTADNSPTA